MRVLASGDSFGCSGGHCPTVFEDDVGLIVQGYVLSLEDRLKMGLPAGEDAVRIPAALLRAAAEKMV